MDKNAPITVEIVNPTRLALAGKATEELYIGDVLELAPADAHDLIGNGKAKKSTKKPGRFGRSAFEAAEKKAAEADKTNAGGAQ